MYKDITGVILCGGRSSRMGVNKALLNLGGSFIIERMTKLAGELFERVILITNEPELYKFLNIESFKDIYSDRGPLGGIHSGLIHSSTEKNFILSCDIPLISKDTVKFIADYHSAESIKVPFADGYIQQLCGVYSKSCLPLTEELLREEEIHVSGKKCMVLRLVESAGSKIIDIEKEMPAYEPDTFLNVNDISEYNKAEIIFKSRLTL